MQQGTFAILNRADTFQADTRILKEKLAELPLIVISRWFFSF